MNIPAAVVKNRVVQAGLFLFATWILFNAIFFLGTHPSRWIETLFQWITRIVWENTPDGAMRDFLVYGLIAAIGGFLVYVPNIVLMFLFSHLLFHTGLSPMAARFLNPVFRFFGLNGESFQPLLFGFGCSVNAIHGAMYIQNRRNRIITMLISPFMSCGSKFGVYVLLISVVFSPRLAGSVMFGLYVLGIAAAAVSSFAFRAILRIRQESTAFEPGPVSLKKPCVARIIGQTLVDGWKFCKKAGSVIVVASVVIWTFSYWPGISREKYDEYLEYGRQNNQEIPSRYALAFHNSYAAGIGKFIEPFFRPLGQNWKSSLALLASVAGRTTIISTLITLYGIEYSPASAETLTHALSADPAFPKLAGFAMMIFVLLCGGCLASVMMFWSETKSLALTGLFVLYPVALAWTAGAALYGIGRLVTAGNP